MNHSFTFGNNTNTKHKQSLPHFMRNVTVDICGSTANLRMVLHLYHIPCVYVSNCNCCCCVRNWKRKGTESRHWILKAPSAWGSWLNDWNNEPITCELRDVRLVPNSAISVALPHPFPPPPASSPSSPPPLFLNPIFFLFLNSMVFLFFSYVFLNFLKMGC